MNLDSILRDGKELSEREVEFLEKIIDMEDHHGSLRIEKKEYLICVSPHDADYSEVRDRDCDEEIRIVEGQELYDCPGCGRLIHIDDKNPIPRPEFNLQTGELRDFIRSQIKSIDGIESCQTIQGGRKYLGTQIEPILRARYGDQSVILPILTEDIATDILDSICIYNKPAVLILTGSSLHHCSRIQEHNIPSLSIGTLFDPEIESPVELKKLLDQALEKFPEHGSEHKATLAADLYQRRKKDLQPDDFEHCTQNLLKYILGTSKLIEGEIPGAEVPDGALTLNWENESSIYIWDAKFVTAWENPETELSGEYDKMYKHFTQFRSESDARAFGGLEGFILFSPAVKSAHVKRLAEIIEERSQSYGTPWSGYICHFRFDALLALFDSIKNNREDVLRKQNSFQRLLNRFLTNPTNHAHEPEEFTEAGYNLTDVSKEDIDRLFDHFLSAEDPEQREHNKKGYLRRLESLTRT